jgi:PhzF family phenazine biosynthesis protein
MQLRPFQQVDVFTATPYRGNPLAVVLDGSGLSDDDFQRFAQWTNLSETTFILAPSDAAKAQGADYQVRIFTPGGELPFAGHPTLGSCHAWLSLGQTPRQSDLIVQECKKGLIPIRREQGRLAFAAPALDHQPAPLADLEGILIALGLRPDQVIASQHLNNGPHWLGLLVDTVDTVLALEPNHQQLAVLGQKVGVAAVNAASPANNLIAKSNREARAFGQSISRHKVQSADEGPILEVRAFAAAIGVNEDPVTGSLNASLAQWLMAEGVMPTTYVAHQGTCLGRQGRVYLQRDAQSQVWVGGDVQSCINGSVLL